MRTKKIVVIFLSFSLLFGTIFSNVVAAKKKVSLSYKKITITKGKSKTIRVRNTKKNVKWKIVSGKKYITLKKKGKIAATVKGKKKGTAKIQAILGKKKLSCTVIVKEKVNNNASGSSTAKVPAPFATTRPSVTSVPPVVTQKPKEPSNPINAPAGANEQDVAALKKLIVELRRRGAWVSEDMSSGEYTWENGRLTKIIWFQIGLSGELDVSGLTELSYLDCSYNEFLDNLNVTKNEKLTFLKCECGQLSSLDVTKNQNLTTLYCSENPISNLDLTKNKNLEHLACAGNPLNSLDVTKNINLIDLDCVETQLSSLDVTKNVNLKYLFCDSNKLDSLDVTQNVDLIDLTCSDNPLSSLDVTKNVKLTYLGCSYNQLSSLDVTKNVNLIEFFCSNNQLSNLDLSQNENLERLSCGNNPLNKLDVTKNAHLKYLTCSDSQLNSLDITKNANLLELVCVNNQLSNLDLTKSESLERLECDSNKLRSLDVTRNLNLRYLHCSENQLSNLDLTKSENLTSLACIGNQLNQLDVTQNKNLGSLDCSDNQLSSLDLTKNVKLTNLSCSSNQLRSLDVTQNQELAILHCQGNQLSSLDVTKNVKLRELDCTSNQLSSLDVSKNKRLKNLRCDSTVIVINGEQTPSISTPTPSTGTQTFQPAPPSPTIKSTPWPTPPSIATPTPTATPGGNKATPTPGIQKDNKFKAGDKEITVDDKDDSVYPVIISDLNEVTWTSESKRPDVDPITDGKSFNRDGSISFTSLKDYNSGVCFYLNPCTDESQLEEYGEDGRLAYRNGDKDMSAYDYIRMKVTCENELCLRTYSGSEQFENAGFPGSSTSETYERGWFHTTEESIWADETTFSAGNTAKPRYATRTIFIPISSLMDKGCDPATMTAIGISPQAEGAECTIHYIDFVKVKYDTKVTGIEVAAKKTEIEPGRVTSVVATITPKDAVRRMVKWSSGDEEVATVNFAGNVIAKKEGKVTITATATDGSNVTGSVEITVKEDDPVIAETHTIDLTSVTAKTNPGCPGAGEGLPAEQTAEEIKFASAGTMLFVDMSAVLADEDLTAYDELRVKYQLKNVDGTDADSYKVASPGWGNFALVAKRDLNGYTNPGLLKGTIGNYISDTAVFDLSEMDAADAPKAAGFNLQFDGGSMTDSDQYMTITEITLYKAE